MVGGSRVGRAAGWWGAPRMEGQLGGWGLPGQKGSWAVGALPGPWQAGGRAAVTAVHVPLQVRRRQLHLPLQLGLASGLCREASGGADGERDHHQSRQRPELQPRGYLLQVSGAVLWQRHPIIPPSLPG